MENNLATSSIELHPDRQQDIFVNPSEPEIALYLALDKPLEGGPLTLFLKIDENSQSTLPPLRWEYYGWINGRLRWIELKISDETKMLKNSGLLVLLARKILPKSAFWKAQILVKSH